MKMEDIKTIIWALEHYDFKLEYGIGEWLKMDDKLREIVNHYGIKQQLKKFNEETFELIEAVTINEVDNFDLVDQELVDKIVEEIADVAVLLKQIQLYYFINESFIKKIMEQKIDRQLNRIKIKESD